MLKRIKKISKLPPKFALKNCFFFSISRKIIIFLVKPTSKYFIKRPRYINIFKQGWLKSDYIDKKPENFDNPVEFGFGGCQPHCEIPGCKNVAIIRCSWYQKSLCLKHFFNDYHFCTTYNP